MEPRPDYQGGGIVNLMASLIRALGGTAAAPELTLLPASRLGDARQLALLVIDGLGADWLARQSPDGLLMRHCLGAITTVFPTTTAAAIPTFLTGDAPLQHGLTGWYTYLGELGCVMTVLPGTPRYGGVSYRQAGIDPARIFTRTPVFDRIAARSTLIAPRWIVGSDFNQVHAGRARVLSGGNPRELFRRAAQALRAASGWRWRRARRERHYLYLYWPGLDMIGHRQGMDSPAALAHLQELEQLLEQFMTAIAGTDTLVLVTADHGQLDTRPADVIDLADHPDLADCLLLPLCGEPRAAFCHLRADRADRFPAICQAALGDRVVCRPSRELVTEGLFGLGTPHPRLHDRIGDWCLLPRARWTVRQWLPGEERHAQIGVHGGLSAAELRVPLCRLAA